MAKKIFLSEDKKRLEFDEKEYLVKPIDISLEDFNYLIPAYVSIEGILHPYWRTSNDFGKLDTVNNKKADNKKNVNISLDDVLKIDASTDIAQTLNTKYPYTDNYGNIVKSVMGEDSSFSVQSAIGFFSQDVRRKKMARLNASNGFIHTSYNSPTSTAYQNINILSLSQFGESRIIASSNTEDNVPCTIELIFKTSPGLDADILVPTRSGTLALLSDTSNSLLNYYTKTETVTNFVGVQNVQTINETKTFSKSPIVPNATLGSHAVNKNQLDLKVDKNESNEVLQSFDLHQKDGSYISVDVDGLKVSKGGVYTLYKPDSLKPINQVPSAAYQFQEILFPKRTATGVEEKVYTITYVNGVKANENGKADIWGVANNWTNAIQRFSGLKPENSKHNDATYNRILGMDSNGNINEVGIPALTNAMNKATDEQIDAHRIASRKTNETYSIGKSRVDNILPSMVASSLFYPQYLGVTGSGLYINTETQTSSVWLVKVRDELGNPLPLEQQTETLIPYIDVTQTLPSRLGFGFDFTRITNGFYQLRVINNGIPSDLGGNLRVVQELPNTPFLSNLTWKEYNTGDYSNIIKEESGNSGTINLPQDGMIRLMTFPVIFSKASLKDLRSYSIGFDVLSYNAFSGSHYYRWEFGLIDNNNYIQVIASGIEGRNYAAKNFQAILSIERGLVSFTRFDTTVFNATVQLSDTATDYRVYFKCAINAVSGNFRTTIQAQSLIEL